MKKKPKILIVRSRYNNTTELYESAYNELDKRKIKNVESKFVNGAFEIPVTISKNINKYDAFLALGCVIKGQTPHFDLISSSTFNSILNISITFNKPIGNGIITAYNMQQALQRCKITTNKKPNKGSEAVNAVMSILKNGPKKI